MEITNQHRDIYKVINNQNKKGKKSKYSTTNEEYKYIVDLMKENYLLFDNEYFYINPDKLLEKKVKEKAYKFLNCKEKKLRLDIKRCEKPKFGGRGRTWSSFKHLINSQETELYTDTSWGNYFYFAAPDGRWYKISINNRENLDVYQIDFNIDINEILTGSSLNFILQF